MQNQQSFGSKNHHFPPSSNANGMMLPMEQLKGKETNKPPWKPWGCRNLCPNGETKYFPGYCKSIVCKWYYDEIGKKQPEHGHLRHSEPSKIRPNTNKLEAPDQIMTHHNFYPKNIQKRPGTLVSNPYQPHPTDHDSLKARFPETMVEHKENGNSFPFGGANSLQHSKEKGNNTFLSE